MASPFEKLQVMKVYRPIFTIWIYKAIFQKAILFLESFIKNVRRLLGMNSSRYSGISMWNIKYAEKHDRICNTACLSWQFCYCKITNTA